ncbi:MAG TPA: VWA domain-containing protein, partial [Leptospiraceae bacterium]|nr:VWA domain-containing protein [Leptospiraceae bacterium]
FSELAAGKTPSEKVYLSRRKRKRDLAVLILLDISLSTDAYTGGERILDVEKRSVALLSEILAESEDDFAIDAFFSKTRNHISYLNVKRFSEGWAPARGRLGGLEATGYTRIGPAIRHATAEILSRSARKKWILLLSDGKPNDYDRYEGRYGMADVRRALKEARNADVHTFALAVEASARHYLPLMLGQGRYRILPHPSMLPEALTEFYARLRAG